MASIAFEDRAHPAVDEFDCKRGLAASLWTKEDYQGVAVEFG